MEAIRFMTFLLFIDALFVSASLNLTALNLDCPYKTAEIVQAPAGISLLTSPRSANNRHGLVWKPGSAPIQFRSWQNLRGQGA
jgi:hypothetical protein